MGRLAAVHHANDRIAGAITGAVGTMACAYLFAALALVSLPDAIGEGRQAIVTWIAQSFLQLVLLSVILVGQRLQAERADDRHDVTHRHLVDLHAKVDALTPQETP